MLLFSAEGAMAIDINESLGGPRIRTDEGCYDLMYWSIKFGVSMDQLLEAVARVGPRVMDVQRALGLSTTVPDVPPNHDSWVVQSDRIAFLVRNDTPAPLSVLDD